MILHRTTLSRIFTQFFIFSVVVIFLTGCTQSTAPQQNSSIDTSNWLVYENKEYGFKFRYPKEWSLKEEMVELESRIFPGQKLKTVQLRSLQDTVVTFLPEGGVDHGLSENFIDKKIVIDNKETLLEYSDSYQVYFILGYPTLESQFRIESRIRGHGEFDVVEAIVNSLIFNS